MSNQTLQFINKTAKKDRYNILTFDTHERYQIQLAKTGHNFYAFRYDGCKEWDESYGKRPDNYYTLPQNAVLNGIDFDFILSQSKFGQFQAAQQINAVFKLPVVSLEHTLPIAHWPSNQLEAFRGMKGDINVFISEYSEDKWDMGDHEVVHHSVDTNLFTDGGHERSPEVLSVVNDFINRDYCCNYQGWQRITKDMPVKVLGKTDGLSKPADSIEALSLAYQQSQVFLNTSTVSPIPTSLLEAMACGCACVSTATCMIPEIIKHDVNGLISNDEAELREYVQRILKDHKLRERLGAAARETVLQHFSEQKFIDSWNTIFNKAYRVIT